MEYPCCGCGLGPLMLEMHSWSWGRILQQTGEHGMQTELLEAEEIPAWAPRVHSPLHDPALITLCLYKVVLVLHTPVLSFQPNRSQASIQ